LSLIKIFSSLPSVEMTGHLGTSGWSGLGGGEAATKPTPHYNLTYACHLEHSERSVCLSANISFQFCRL